MKKILNFLSAMKNRSARRPKTSGDKLNAFLMQCHAQGAHFLFHPSTINNHRRENQLQAMTQALDLSHQESEALLEQHLPPLFTFHFGPAEFFTAMNHQGQQAFPCQLCEHCAPGLFKHYGDKMADSCWCSQCHQNGICLDVALIEHYRKCGIDDETICHELPRTRWGSRGEPPTYQSIKAIEAAHQSVFEASRGNTNTVL